MPSYDNCQESSGSFTRYPQKPAQAVILSYLDLYWIFAVLSALMLVLSFLLKKNTPGEGGHVVVH